MFRQTCVPYLKFLFVPVLLSPLSGLSQSSNSAAVGGIVEDATDARIPDAKVKLINTDTGTENTATTSKAGNFTIPSVLPGHYSLQIERDGFDTTQLTDITLNIGDNRAVIVRMRVGSAQQTVNVDGGGLTVNRTDGSVSTVVDHKIVENAPLNGRDITQLLAIQAGVFQTSSNGTQGNGFSVNGSRQTGVNFFLDGGENVNTYQNFSGLFPNPDAVEEFRVQTNNFSAEYGNATGAVVSVETKSGTNQFHGSLFEYVRNQIFNARNYFATSRDSLKRNQFGGTVGGPILKNRLFFFFPIRTRRSAVIRNSRTRSCRPLRCVRVTSLPFLRRSSTQRPRPPLSKIRSRLVSLARSRRRSSSISPTRELRMALVIRALPS